MEHSKNHNPNNWTAYLAALSISVAYFLGKEITSDSGFFPYGVFAVLLIGVPPVMIHFFISKGKSDIYKRNSMIIISLLLVVVMVVVVAQS